MQETGVYPKCHPVPPEELAVLQAAGLPPRPPLCSSAPALLLLWSCAEAGQLAEISGELIVFQIQTWLPAQAQGCQSQRKTEARTMRLGKEEEEEKEEGGISPVAVHISAGCRGASSRHGASGRCSKTIWTKLRLRPDLEGKEALLGSSTQI